MSTPITGIEQDPAVWPWDQVIAESRAKWDALALRVRVLQAAYTGGRRMGRDVSVCVNDGPEDLVIGFTIPGGVGDVGILRARHFEPLVAGHLEWRERTRPGGNLMRYTFTNPLPPQDAEGMSWLTD